MSRALHIQIRHQAQRLCEQRVSIISDMEVPCRNGAPRQTSGFRMFVVREARNRQLEKQLPQLQKICNEQANELVVQRVESSVDHVSHGKRQCNESVCPRTALKNRTKRQGASCAWREGCSHSRKNTLPGNASKRLSDARAVPLTECGCVLFR